MSDVSDKDWKQSIGFPINYDSQQSSDDNFDADDVVFRRHGPRSSRHLLEDEGDGAAADLLGTTPPRARIRNKEKRRTVLLDSGNAQKMMRDNRRNTMDNFYATEQSPEMERSKKRASLKLNRTRERDWKQELGAKEFRADSLPSPKPQTTHCAPTLVESCSRFMSLTSKLKCRTGVERNEPSDREDEFPESRVSFHKTFSLLINMGAGDKGARRTISREEKVWQNELKDLIWLELQAKIAGRSLAQQDAFLCAQRDIVPTLIKNIMEYRFLNKKHCGSQVLVQTEGSGDEINKENHENITDDDEVGCLKFDCMICSDNVGKALRELGTLLDSFYNAISLFPSSKAMTAEHPLVATSLFNNRVKAMCLWYNIAMHMRIKMLAVRKLLRTMHEKNVRQYNNFSSYESDISSRQSVGRSVHFSTDPLTDPSVPDSDGSHDSQVDEESDVIDNSPLPKIQEPYSTVDSTLSSDSGYHSERKPSAELDDIYNLGSLTDLTNLSVLDKCEVSPFRNYLSDILKKQSVRRSMMFIQKLKNPLLGKVHITLQKPEIEIPEQYEEDAEERQHDEDNQEHVKNAHELRRYGWHSPERRAMRLPCCRGPFLLLTSLGAEVMLALMRLRSEQRPRAPSSLTVKQMIHELKECIDIATEIRAGYIKNVEAALSGYSVTKEDKGRLLLVIRNFDATVESVMQQYLSYLGTMAADHGLSRACLQTEWGFTCRLAARVPALARLAPEAFTDIICSQIERLVKQLEEKFNEVAKREEELPSETDDTDVRKNLIYAVCRDAHSLYGSERDAALHAAHFARHVAVGLTGQRVLRQRLVNSVMSIRDCIAHQTTAILEHSIPPTDLQMRDLYENLIARLRELLLQVFRLGFEIHKELHKLSMELKSSSRKSMVSSPSIPKTNRSRSDSIDETDGKGFEDFRYLGQKLSSIELLLSEEQPQDSEEVVLRSKHTTTEDTEEWAAQVARAIIQYAECWMKFVTERCERGRGLRPRWAHQGLEFLMLACDPHNTKYLTDTEFEVLKSHMDACISHVVGSQRGTVTPVMSPVTVAPPSRRHVSPHPTSHPPSTNKDVPTPPTPPVEPDPLLNFHCVQNLAHTRRVQEALRHLESDREHTLQLRGSIGRVTGVSVTDDEPKLRQVTFKWQRGLKIGAGTFGKVYTVIKLDTGQVLAMKEVSIAGERRAARRAANELRVLQGVTHPHLVTYYGCEVHREEMLIFMELCVEGSLEALLMSAGALPEDQVRKYTKQLLSAVIELHSRQIVHRDIKSGNIFLTNERHCLKLGDFGCAVKIRANTTAVGELQGTVGTQAYMAPEVFMKSSGHGRAADVWSLGCVVAEMASGKRPFSQYDSNYQIMYMVGTGSRPDIPATLSHEGRLFCVACLTHEPTQRPPAKDLSQHHFLMVKSDDDCNCQPGYLITKMK